MSDGYNILEMQRDRMLMDILMRLTAIENILIKKNIISNEEIQKEILEISSLIAKSAIESISIKLNSTELADLNKWVDSATFYKKNKSN